MKFKKRRLKIKNMQSLSCEANLEMAVRKIDGVINVFANHHEKFITIEYNNKICNAHMLKSYITGLGYSINNRRILKIMAFLTVFLPFIVFKLMTT